MHLNQTSVWKVMTIWISGELPLCNFERLDILCVWIGLPCDKLWPFEFLESFRCSISSFSIYYAPESDFRLKSYDHLNLWRAFVVQFRASWYIMRLNWTSVWYVMTIWISRQLPLLISSVSIYYSPESDFRVISYDHLNFSRASVVQIRGTLYVMRLNRTSELKVKR